MAKESTLNTKLITEELNFKSMTRYKLIVKINGFSTAYFGYANSFEEACKKALTEVLRGYSLNTNELNLQITEDKS